MACAVIERKTVVEYMKAENRKIVYNFF